MVHLQAIRPRVFRLNPQLPLFHPVTQTVVLLVATQAKVFLLNPQPLLSLAKAQRHTPSTPLPPSPPLSRSIQVVGVPQLVESLAVLVRRLL